MNPMHEVLIEKVVVNMGVGGEPEEMKKAGQIIQIVTGKKPIQTLCKVRAPEMGLRPGLPIGLKVTLRGTLAAEFLKKAFVAKEAKLLARNFDREGNFGFGISEYINMPGAKYDPKLGIKGFDVLVALKKRGYRVKIRKIRPSPVGRKQRVSPEEAMNFVKGMGVEVQ